MQEQTAGQPVAIVPPRNGTIRTFSVLHIITGFVAIICGILLIVMEDQSMIRNIGGGIWGGIWFVLTGIIGLATVSRFGAFIAFNVISTVISGINGLLFIGTIVGIIMYCQYNNRGYVGKCIWGTSEHNVVLYIILFALMVMEFIGSIIAAAFGCKYGGCCRQNQSNGQVLYQPASSAPVVYYTTPGAYPQQTGMATYPGQMVSQPPPGAMYVGAQGQQMPPQMAYPGQQMPAQTDIVYSAQSADFNMAPPPYNPKAPPH